MCYNIPMARTSDHSIAHSLATSIGFRLSRLARLRRASWESELADLELAPGDAAVLRALGDGDGVGLRALARTLGQDPMTLKRCVDRLETRGLLESLPGEDRRIRALRVTRSGRRLAEAVAERARRRDEVFLSVLGPRDLETFDFLLSRLEQHINDHHEEDES